MGPAKWYLGMRIKQPKEYMSIDQEQYAKTITSRFEKVFKHPFKLKDSPLPTSFIPSKQDCPIIEPQIKEVKLRFGNLNYRCVIGALLYISCCTRSDISFAVSKLANFSNNLGLIHFRCLLHLIGYIKNTPSKGLKFYSVHEHFQTYQLKEEHNITSDDKSVITFSDSSWNYCVDTGKSTGGHITFIKGGTVDYGSHLPVPVAMLSSKAKYASAAVACMWASHLRMLIYDLKLLCSEDHNRDIMEYEPANIIFDKENATSMARYNKDTARNRNVARRFHYLIQCTALNKHKIG